MLRFSNKKYRKYRKSRKKYRKRRKSKDYGYIDYISAYGILAILYTLYKLNKSEESSEESPEKIANRHGYTIKRIRGDGSCMFRSIADQLNDRDHKKYRTLAVNYLRNLDEETRQHIQDCLVDITLEDYLNQMGDLKNNMWGDHYELQALANVLQRRIIVIRFNSPEREQEIIIPRNLLNNEVLPYENNNNDIVIGFYGNHYDSLHRINTDV
jgi:hypothetical protein